VAIWYFIYLDTDGLYGSNSTGTPINTFILIPILILISVFAIVRLLFVIIKKDRSHIFYDGLLFASASAFIFAYIFVFKFYHPYYFAPATVLFLPVVVYWLINFYDNKYFVIFAVILLFLTTASYLGVNSIKKNMMVFYNVSKAFQYNMMKLDMFAKYGRSLVWYDTINSDHQQALVESYLNYLNTDFFAGKVLDDIEIIKTDYKISRFLSGDQIINKNSIYLVYGVSDLAEFDNRFTDFVPLGHWKIVGTNSRNIEDVYSFIHKEKLK
jgi:hypothetical protein